MDARSGWRDEINRAVLFVSCCLTDTATRRSGALWHSGRYFSLSRFLQKGVFLIVFTKFAEDAALREIDGKVVLHVSLSLTAWDMKWVQGSGEWGRGPMGRVLVLAECH